MRNFLIKAVFLFLAISSAGAQFESPVSWTASVNKIEGGKYNILFNARIKEPWHMYAIKLLKEGPIPTSFVFKEGAGYKLSGEIAELVAPVIKYDEGFQFDVGMYSKNASFSQEVEINSDKKVPITVFIEYQCCNDETCLPPLSDTITVNIPATPGRSVKAESSPVLSDTSLPLEEEIQPAPDKASTIKTGINVLEDDYVQVKSKDKASFLFFLIAFFAGLAAILTPCVFPMIPMIVSFFMRDSEDRVKAVLKGLVYGLSIIILYTGLGVIVSFTGVDANIGNVLSTHWIPNLIFFIFFMIFAASFLGMFELVIPSGLINRADRQADKGGMAGAFFMGITTVLVSFSCTGPIVGSLLIEAAGDTVLKPILGMFFFSLAFALPFTFLAIFPSFLKNLPKSGSWLNSIKVVLGFLILAFGLKFLSNIDQSYHLNLISREIYLGIWFVLSIFLGFYLLGKLKLFDEPDITHISVSRLLLSVVIFTFSVYLFTGIMGADLKSISSLIPPKSGHVLSFSEQDDQQQTIVASTNWCGPGKYNDLFTLSNGLKGYFSYEDGLACSKRLKKPIFLDFTGHSCSNCKQMESRVWPAGEVISKLRNDFVIISLYTDDKTRVDESEWVTRKDGKVLKNIGDINKYFQIDQFNTISTPWYVLLDSDGNVLVPPRGKDLDVKSFSSYLQSGIDKYNASIIQE